MPASVPRLAGHRLQGDHGVDGRTVRFLLQQSLALQKKEKEAKEREEKEEEEQNEAMIRAHLHAIHSSSWYQERKEEKRRKKKRKKKKEHLRTFSLVAALVVDSSRGMFRSYAVRSPSFPAVACAALVLLVLHFALCSFTLSSGPRCSASWPV